MILLSNKLASHYHNRIVLTLLRVNEKKKLLFYLFSLIKLININLLKKKVFIWKKKVF